MATQRLLFGYGISDSALTVSLFPLAGGPAIETDLELTQDDDNPQLYVGLLTGTASGWHTAALSDDGSLSPNSPWYVKLANASGDYVCRLQPPSEADLGGTGDAATLANQELLLGFVDTVESKLVAALALLAELTALTVADRYIDVTTTPWQLVLIGAGTGGLGVGVELLRQNLYDVSGALLVDTLTPVGRSVTP